MKAVLDTNVLVSGIFWSGPPSKIIELWNRERFEVVASESMLDEYLRTIQSVAKKAKREDLFEKWSIFLARKLILVSPKKKFKICRDPKDDQVLDGAMACKAKYIVSGDKDLLVLKEVIEISILTPKEFLISIAN